MALWYKVYSFCSEFPSNSGSSNWFACVWHFDPASAWQRKVTLTGGYLFECYEHLHKFGFDWVMQNLKVLSVHGLEIKKMILFITYDN